MPLPFRLVILLLGTNDRLGMRGNVSWFGMVINIFNLCNSNYIYIYIYLDVSVHACTITLISTAGVLGMTSLSQWIFHLSLKDYVCTTTFNTRHTTTTLSRSVEIYLLHFIWDKLYMSRIGAIMR